MCRGLAASVGGPIEVSDIERDLGSVSYTIDTLGALSKVYPEHRLRLVIGADVFLETSRWHRWDRISTEYDPIVVGRNTQAGQGDGITFPDISSTVIRERLRSGLSVQHLVPVEVLDILDPRWYTGTP
jgi:nicotinate-nucleotide adenylyltransferase